MSIDAPPTLSFFFVYASWRMQQNHILGDPIWHLGKLDGELDKEPIKLMYIYCNKN
jgi:hypothetical protein